VTWVSRDPYDALSHNTLRLGARMRLGATFTTIDTTSGVVCHFTDGTAGAYDFIVGADGPFLLRTAMFGANTGQGSPARASGVTTCLDRRT
jgi:hypothetical protein